MVHGKIVSSQARESKRPVTSLSSFSVRYVLHYVFSTKTNLSCQISSNLMFFMFQTNLFQFSLNSIMNKQSILKVAEEGLFWWRFYAANIVYCACSKISCIYSKKRVLFLAKQPCVWLLNQWLASIEKHSIPSFNLRLVENGKRGVHHNRSTDSLLPWFLAVWWAHCHLASGIAFRLRSPQGLSCVRGEDCPLAYRRLQCRAVNTKDKRTKYNIWVG